MTRKHLIAILGYGSQGRAIALNLKDSGYKVKIGLRPGSKTAEIVEQDGLTSAPIMELARKARVVVVALPDHVHAHVLTNAFFLALENRPPVIFLHGSSIHFKQVVPPPTLTILLLAPHAPGVAVRQNFLDKKPYSAFFSVHQGVKKDGQKLLYDFAAAIGIGNKHMIKTTFADESIGDLFGEQAVLCGGMARLLKLGFETLIEGGLTPQNAYLEVAYQLDLIVALVKQYGLKGMLDRISPLARYGAVKNGPIVIDDKTKDRMKNILAEITSGAFIEKAEKTELKIENDAMIKLTNALFDRQAKRFADKD